MGLSWDTSLSIQNMVMVAAAFYSGRCFFFFLKSSSLQLGIFRGKGMSLFFRTSNFPSLAGSS